MACRSVSQVPAKKKTHSKKRKIDSSPSFQPTAEDYRNFKKITKTAYGVEIHDEEKLVRYEKTRLLCDTRVPLNNCGSKYVHMGLDPFDNFAVSIRILKKDVEAGICFTEETLQAFLNEIPDILCRLSRNEIIDGHELVDYKLYGSQNGCLKFVPVSGEGFQLYVSDATLANLRSMRNLLHLKIQQLKEISCDPDEFFNDAAQELVKQHSTSACSDLVFNVLSSRYADDVILNELVCKFINYVLREVSKYINQNYMYNAC